MPKAVASKFAALVDVAAFSEARGFTKQALSKALASDRLFYLEVGAQRYQPAFFIDPRCEPSKVERGKGAWWPAWGGQAAVLPQCQKLA